MTFGKFNVDYEQRIFNPERMRQYRLNRAQAMLKKHKLGSMIIFDLDTMRYLSYCRHAGWDKHRLGVETLLLVKDAGYPYCPAGGNLEKTIPWYKDKNKLKYQYPFQVRATIFSEFNAGQWALQAEEVKGLLKEHGVLGEPCGVDVTCMHMVDAFRKAGIELVSGTEAIMEARMIKNEDEVECIRTAGSIADAAYWEVANALRPGMTEMQVAGIAAKACYDQGAEELEGPAFVLRSGPRSTQGTASDRVIRPGEMVVVDINGVSFMGYRTCYYRTFCVGDKPTERQKRVYQNMVESQLARENSIKAGVTNHEVTKAYLKAGEGKPWGEHAPAAGGGHGGGKGHDLGLCSGDAGPGWGGSLDLPDQTIEKGRVLAIECRFQEGDDAASVENVGLVTETGFEILWKFPYKELITVGLPGVY
jgi:Xaa-Pro aminopeptidase